MQPFIGQIIAVGFNFAPVNWALCNGQLLPISQNDALFNLIGTTYGGDGVQTFALPNLQGRVPLNAGQPPSSPAYVIGAASGTETVTLLGNQVASHTHPVPTSSATGTTSTPGPQSVLGVGNSTPTHAYAPGPADTPLNAAAVGPAGGSQPHENRQPFLTINYIIALYGIYPSQA